jgi:hypothetical protein
VEGCQVRQSSIYSGDHVLTVVAARKNGPPQKRAATWLAILTLGTLRSPFAPYVTFPVLWLLSVNSTEVRGVRATILLVVVG